MFNILHLFGKRNLYLNCKLLKSGGNAINSAQRKMRPNKTGQIAKCNIPLPNENPSQLYIISEIKNEDERPSAEVKALHTGTSLLPTKNVFLDNLEVVEVDTNFFRLSDLRGVIADSSFIKNVLHRLSVAT